MSQLIQGKLIRNTENLLDLHFPRSRAMAVAASADYFGVFSLKSSDTLQSQMLQGELDPISEVLTYTPSFNFQLWQD